MANFVERRKESRLPYDQKVILTDGVNTMTGSAMNISRGGLFIKTLEPFPIDTLGHLTFVLPNHEGSLCVSARVAHVVFDRFRAEIECGMGITFMDLDAANRTLINLHIMSTQEAYVQLQKLLKNPRPDSAAVAACLAKLPQLAGMDLADLRYRVNRICTIFEPATEDDALHRKLASA